MKQHLKKKIIEEIPNIHLSKHPTVFKHINDKLLVCLIIGSKHCLFTKLTYINNKSLIFNTFVLFCHNSL